MGAAAEGGAFASHSSLSTRGLAQAWLKPRPGEAAARVSAQGQMAVNRAGALAHGPLSTAPSGLEASYTG